MKKENKKINPDVFRNQENNDLKTISANHSYEGSGQEKWATTEVKLINGLSLFLRAEELTCEDGTASASSIGIWISDDKTERAEYLGQVSQEEIRGERNNYTYNDVSIHMPKGKGGPGIYRTIIHENEYGEDLV